MSEWRMQRNEVEKLIAAYKKCKCLWDFRSNEYKRYALKKYAWLKLANLFGKEVIDIKRKIKNLRSAYVSEKKKVDDSYGTGRIYQPNLYYYKNLNFLDSMIVCRKGIRFEAIQNKSDPIEEDDEQEQPDEIKSTFNEQYVTDADAVSLPSPSSSPERKAMSHMKIKVHQHRQAPYYSKLDTAVKTLAKVTKTTSDSIYTAFGKTIALQLSQLSPLDATATMSEIHQVLSKNVIKCMISKSRQSINKRETHNGHGDKEMTALTVTEIIENKLGENNYHPNEFEEVSM